MTLKLLTGVLVLALAAVFLLGLYYLKCLKRMQKLLRDYQETGTACFSTMKETRESKLENTLQRLLDQAEKKEAQAKRERDEVASLLSDLTHQLKTPMANVIMYTELLEDENLTPEERQRFTYLARTQAKKMQWLLGNMLKASQLERGMISFSAEYTGIRETIRQAVSSVYAQAEERDIMIKVEPFEDRKLYHNPRWTAEAMENILDNAVKYSPSGSVVTVRVQPMEIYTQIEISDQGIGISGEEYNKIFRRFYRSSNAAQTEGSGLGLYLAQLILNNEKGGENQVKALDGVNLSVEEGEFVSVVGTSGSGKSTLLHMLGGLDYATSGSVFVSGKEIFKLNESELTIFRRRNIGFIFQNYNLVPVLNVYENIVLPIQLDGEKPDKRFVGEIMEMLGIQNKKNSMPNQLSGGQQQRVAIARALASKPAIILADEPTGNLDSRTSQEVLGLLKLTGERFHQTIVMITHNDAMAQLSDRVIRIEDGKIVGGEQYEK